MTRDTHGLDATLALADACLFLDLDGTLAPLEDTPSQVVAEPGRTDLIRRAVACLGGRVAVVSGRTIDSVDAILEGACRAVAGVHGLQRRTAAGELESGAPHPRVLSAARQMALFAQGCAGLLVEEKGLSVALHFRGAPGAEAAVMEFVARVAATEALEIQPGRQVLELRLPGPDKGAAVRAFMGELPFRGATPIYVGDDLTDEAAFVEVAHRGGRGVLVGAHRPTAAGAWIDGPSAVLRWLDTSLSRGAFAFGRPGLAAA